MAIERKTIVNQYGADRFGNMFVQLGLLLVEDGTELSCKWHRTTVPLTVNPAMQLESTSAALVSAGNVGISAEDIAMLLDFHAQYVAQYDE